MDGDQRTDNTTHLLPILLHTMTSLQHNNARDDGKEQKQSLREFKQNTGDSNSHGTSTEAYIYFTFIHQNRCILIN